ncbi:MAG: UDP-N-acetylmuramoyl-tripeptide--D-alanyl-D-alanine ligase, partial [Pseudomonadota bacterium]
MDVAFEASGIAIDSRAIAEGDLFIALEAARDGHDFVAKALAAGASGAMVSRHPQDVPKDAPLIFVDDTFEGLERLGQARRVQSHAKVVAITGSVGKTSTKEMVRVALAPFGAVHAAEKSFNNHWGVPLTLARMPKTADFAVIEIGMNQPHEIAPLARMAAPDIALITTVGLAHVEAFEGIDGIAKEKGAIFEGLSPNGTAVFHDDIETSALAIVEGLAWQSGATCLRFGSMASA